MQNPEEEEEEEIVVYKKTDKPFKKREFEYKEKKTQDVSKKPVDIEKKRKDFVTQITNANKYIKNIKEKMLKTTDTKELENLQRQLKYHNNRLSNAESGLESLIDSCISCGLPADMKENSYPHRKFCDSDCQTLYYKK
jgi:transcription initiation factor TFIIIB Brf1 subunit/transcription initiation factor TFIIB